ncbi:hypothetical protein [Kaistella rhinocerotis]|uniref:hypothetical protein n=1 Tax=Kaistella rhinocerotis TaxID=3026437 RepID=UPI0025523675|nr:hypothetical protein [Kaistella sp. Ran72]
MKNLKILFLLIPGFFFCQKYYEVGNTYWIYKSPDHYMLKTDNFLEAAEVGKKVLEKQDNIRFNSDEKILFSVARNVESPYNIIFSSFFPNRNLQKFGNEIYSDKLVQVFEKTFRDLGVEATITKEKVGIDSREFYLIKCDITSPLKYKNYFFFTEIDDQELQITTIFDNPQDEDLILRSVYESKFK